MRIILVGLVGFVAVIGCSSTGSDEGSNAGLSGGPSGVSPTPGVVPAPGAAPAAGQSANPSAGTGVAPTNVGTAPDAAAGSAGSASPGAMPTGTPTTSEDDGTASADCTTPGLQLEGLMYSPGGTLLPFPCEPFDATTNNPYAVRCIDAWPWYKSGYPGDEYCILPPEPGKGVQIGVHPQGLDWYAQVSSGDLSGYDDPPPGFLLPAGGEEERNYHTSSPNTEDINFYRSYVRMRSGSHHMIVSGAPPSAGHVLEQWGPGNVVEGLIGGVSLPGAQRPDENVPKTLEKPADDAGLYTVLGADTTVAFDMHHFNPTDHTILKETWENLWFEDDATIPVVPMFGMPLTEAITTFAQPGQTVDMHYRWDITQRVRLVQLFGHRHVWTSNFSAWVEKPDGSDDILYQSFDWYDIPTYRYDSVTVNPDPMPDARADGASTGLLYLEPGEQLHFNCHMPFTDERAADEAAPTPSTVGPLRFANEAYTGEMCILFGSTAGTYLGQPVDDPSPVPDFATVD